MMPDGTLHGNRYLGPGTKVCLENGLNDAGEEASEYGVVVHCWRHEELGYGFYDCYVAFFGGTFPSGEPADKPYILRYAASTLATIEDGS